MICDEKVRTSFVPLPTRLTVQTTITDVLYPHPVAHLQLRARSVRPDCDHMPDAFMSSNEVVLRRLNEGVLLDPPVILIRSARQL